MTAPESAHWQERLAEAYDRGYAAAAGCACLSCVNHLGRSHCETREVEVALAYGHGFSAGRESAMGDDECTCGHRYSDHPCLAACGCTDG